MGRPRKKNNWEIKGEEAFCYIEEEKAIINAELLPIVSEYTWYIQQKKVKNNYIGGKYVCSQYPIQYKDKKRNRKFLHNVIWTAVFGEIPNGYIIDHIDRNPLNNKLENLRLLTKQENSFNRSVQRNNSSGITGVSYNSSYKKWGAYITYKKCRENLGWFDTKEEAMQARKEKETQYFNLGEQK